MQPEAEKCGDPIAALIEDVLGKQTPATRTAYRKDLADYGRTFHRIGASLPISPDQIVEGVRALLTADFDGGHKIVRNYRQSMDEVRELSSSAINRRLTVLRGIVLAANRRGMVPWVLDIPNVKDEAVKDPGGPTIDEVGAILRSVVRDDSPRGRRAYAIIRMMADLGLRRGAVLSIDFSDLDLPKRVRVKLKGREKKRWKALPGPTRAALKRWIDAHPGRSRRLGPVFVNLIAGMNTRLSGSGFYGEVIHYTQLAGCRTRPHGFRHSAVTNAIVSAARLGETLDSVMQFSDHADFRMVLRYRDASKQAQRKFSDANASAFGDPLSKGAL